MKTPLETEQDKIINDAIKRFNDRFNDSLKNPLESVSMGASVPKQPEQSAGWNYDPPDKAFTTEVHSPSELKVPANSHYTEEIWRAERRRELALQAAKQELNELARKDAARDMAYDVAAQARREMGQMPGYPDPYREAHLAGYPGIDSWATSPAPLTPNVLGPDINIGSGKIKAPVGLEALDNQILDKLNQLEKKLSGLDANLNKIQAPKVEPVNIARDVFAESDLRELERMLDDLEGAARRVERDPRVSVQPTEQDINHLIKTLEDAGAKVVAVNGKPIMASSDLNTYLEREAAMASTRTRNGWVNEPDGTQKHYKNGVLHMDNDSPAEIRPNGTSLYYKNGSLHRDGNLPAMLGVKGTAKFAVNGQYHRLGGLPAVTWSKGPYRNEWWVNGEIERAVRKDGTEEWYAPGCEDRDEAVLSRTDGPAVIHPPDVRGNRREEFWINGNQFNTREQWIGALSRLNDMQEEALEHELIDEDPVDAIDETPVTIHEAKPKTKKEKTMSKPSFTESLKANAVSAGYRVAGTQLTSVVKSAILTVMRDKGADGGAIQAFSTFLDTEFGAAMISFMIGSGLPYVPHFGDDPRVARLATELQVGGMATAGNAIIGEAMQHVLPAVSQILSNLPAADGETTSNVRVIESKDNKLAESLMEEGEEETDAEETSAKTMKA